ncbi:AN1-type zinc finger protein 4 [Schistosoma japonicum]|nr:AN1-type zinc finger protein 4 [Schistosoma japonicum]KAH8864739.1 AN1-type zinc finger protein 4 [Schistosoma japonicum]
MNTPINPEFNEQNPDDVSTSPTNSKGISRLDEYGENITDTTHMSRRNQSLPSFGKNATNILALKPNNSVARATYSSNIISELSNFSRFSPSIYYSESSALKKGKLPSIWRSYILSVTHKKDQELETSLSISDFRGDRPNISKVHNEQQVNGVDNLDHFNNTETSRPTTANFLAGLLASFIPDQTTSTDYVNRPLYAYHWLSKASPLLENEEVNQLTNFSFLDSEESDSFVTSNFEADSDQGEDDVYETDVSRYYSYSLNDDDSQADLRDYLSYYPTGSPSFVYIDCRSHSYYAIQNSLRGNNTRMNGCHGTVETEISSLNSLNHNECPDWPPERDQLVEEVTNLKSKMNIIRLRKQSQHKNTLNTEHAMFREVLKDNQSNDIINWKNNSKQLTETSAYSHDIPITISQNSVDRLSNLRTSSHSSLKKASDFLKLPHTCSQIQVRQRRCATVTPPDINYLIKMTDSQDKDFKSTSIINSSLFCSERISRSSDDNNFKSPSFLTSSQLMAERLSPKKSLTTSVCILLNTESKPYDVPINHTVLPSPNRSQTSQSTLFANPNLINLVRNRSILTRSSSSSVSLLPDSGSSVSTGHSSTSIPSQLPVNGESHLDTPGRFSKLNDCNKKLSNPTPPYYVSSILTEGSRPPSSPNSTRRKRCSMCLRKTGLANSYLCRCDRSFCSLHRYAEVHACQYDYKSEGRRYMIESNVVVTTPKLPKI